MSKYLSLDYGTKRIGVALSDEDGIFAFSQDNIENRNKDYAISKIEKIIKENNVNLIIIGIPLGLDNKPTQMSKKVQSFTELLYNRTGVKIVNWNETLTSEFAKKNLMNLPKRKRNIDSEAARIMLQEYLDFKKETLNHPID